MTKVIPEHVKGVRGKLDQLRQAKGGRMAHRLNKGYVWNPMRSLPPNLSCPCGSGQKFKKCCLPISPRVISKNWEKEWNEAKKKALQGERVW